MKPRLTIRFYFIIAWVLPTLTASAQTVDDILDKYYVAIGGKARWDSLQSVKMTGKITVQGMDIPLTIVKTAQGQQRISIKFQGQETTQAAFDGKQGWSTDFMTQKAQKMEAEENANMKQLVEDFPSAFLHYKDRGYTATLEGTEAIEGREAYQIKLVKKPVVIDGQEQENLTHYFFDTETFLLTATRTISLSGETQGASVETLMTDYRDVQGFLFPFTIATSYNGQPGETIAIENLETNPAIDPKIFIFPE